jgi:short-subunit dehydrogenase
MKVENKVFVVTGGSNGIGRQLTLQLLAVGARVAAVDIDQAGLEETAELAGKSRDRLSLHAVDITERDQVEDLPDQVTLEHGPPDGLINNAGIIQPFERVNELDYEDIQRVMDINFYGTLYMTKAFLPHLLKRPEAHLANVSSMGGFLPVPGQSIYGASKAAVKLFTEGLYSELQNTDVGVTIIFPGAIGTDIAENSGVTREQDAEPGGEELGIDPLPPEKAAQQILQAIGKNRFRALIGSDARFMDFLYRLAPRRAAKFIFRQMESLLG